MRFRTLLVLSLLVMALAPLPAASAAVECHGEPATIVGEPGQDRLRGTPGRDVIVTAGAFEVDAGAGDDLICVTNGPGGETGNVRACDGADEVYNEQGRGGFLWVELGAGPDTFVGGPGNETVLTGEEDGADTDPDVVDTGANWDLVVTGDHSATANADQIDTGIGDDEVQVLSRRQDAGGMLELGPGLDRLWFIWPDDDSGTWVFDNVSQQLSHHGAVEMHWSGVESFDLPDPAANAVSFVGGPGRELVWAASVDHVDLGGGNDRFALEVSFHEPGPAVLAGGSGRDEFAVDWSYGAVVDLRDGFARFRDTDLYGRQALDGFENVYLGGGWPPVTVRGDAGPNRIEVGGCRARVLGRGGDDRLLAAGVERCRATSTAHLRGGGGDDVLWGAATPDVLIGGPGRDRAHGGPGVDRCVAEVTYGCP